MSSLEKGEMLKGLESNDNFPGSFPFSRLLMRAGTVYCESVCLSGHAESPWKKNIILTHLIACSVECINLLNWLSLRVMRRGCFHD